MPGGLVLPNRIMKAAMSEALADARHAPDKRLVRLYDRWSHGGYGLLITGNVMVDRAQLGESGNVVIEDGRNLAPLSRWVKSTHDAGVPIWAQLNHPGRQSNPLAIGHTPVAPSAVPMSLPGSPTPREAYFLDYARTVRKAAGQVPLAVTGGFRSQEAMAQAVKSGDCDVVGLARPTVTMPDAADAILSGRIDVLPTHELRTGMRSLISRFVDAKALDGVLNISWNTDQLHRLGAGLDPDPDRGRLVTTLAMLKRNGTATLRPTRGIR